MEGKKNYIFLLDKMYSNVEMNDSLILQGLLKFRAIDKILPEFIEENYIKDLFYDCNIM